MQQRHLMVLLQSNLIPFEIEESLSNLVNFRGQSSEVRVNPGHSVLNQGKKLAEVGISINRKKSELLSLTRTRHLPVGAGEVVVDDVGKVGDPRAPGYLPAGFVAVVVEFTAPVEKVTVCEGPTSDLQSPPHGDTYWSKSSRGVPCPPKPHQQP